MRRGSLSSAFVLGQGSTGVSANVNTENEPPRTIRASNRRYLALSGVLRERSNAATGPPPIVTRTLSGRGITAPLDTEALKSNYGTTRSFRLDNFSFEEEAPEAGPPEPAEPEFTVQPKKGILEVLQDEDTQYRRSSSCYPSDCEGARSPEQTVSPPPTLGRSLVSLAHWNAYRSGNPFLTSASSEVSVEERVEDRVESYEKDKEHQAGAEKGEPVDSDGSQVAKDGQTVLDRDVGVEVNPGATPPGSPVSEDEWYPGATHPGSPESEEDYVDKFMRYLPLHSITRARSWPDVHLRGGSGHPWPNKTLFKRGWKKIKDLVRKLKPSSKHEVQAPAQEHYKELPEEPKSALQEGDGGTLTESPEIPRRMSGQVNKDSFSKSQENVDGGALTRTPRGASRQVSRDSSSMTEGSERTVKPDGTEEPTLVQEGAPKIPLLSFGSELKEPEY